MKLVLLDFEFNRSKEKVMNLVCVSADIEDESGTTAHDFWLHNDIKAQCSFRKFIQTYSDRGYYFVAWAVIAEARSLLSLPNSFDVIGTKWIDLFLEYRCLQNQDHSLAYGKQLIDGKEKRTFPPKPKWQRTEEDGDNSKPPQSLAAACYKLLGVKIDTDHKNEMRDLIISEPKEFTEEEKTAIMEYCRSDIKYLRKLLNKIAFIYKKRLPKRYHPQIKGWMLHKGDFAARTAVMEAEGYPFSYEATKNFTESVPKIINDIRREINELFPNEKLFTYKKRDGSFSWSHVRTREWIQTLDSETVDDWTLTDGGTSGNQQLSLSLDAFTKFFDFKHSYPKDILGAQVVRMLKTNQSLNGFRPPKKGKSNFWDYVGSDERVRPYTNIYGSQTSRSQPSSTSFIFLKSAWMRVLVQPPSGYAMGGIDYKSQEFLIAALRSGDRNMLTAYMSGDVYLWYGKACGVIPKDATKESHKLERDKFKHSALGVMFRMGATTLARRITGETGEECSKDEAQDYIDYFNEVFYIYDEWNKVELDRYKDEGFSILPDGWIMWGDNKNWRSTVNFPVQGFGGAVMKKAVALSQDAGINVPFTLHDALYLIAPTNRIDEHMDIMGECMIEAFKYYFPENKKEDASAIMLEGNIWSLDFDNETIEYHTEGGLEIKQQHIYVDGRSKDEYEQFKKYFTRDETLDLL